MSATPWNSIAEGVIPLEPRRLSYDEARGSPCASCPTAPCCTYLPLHSFQIRNILELDHALYLLNFDRIELGLSASGEWGVYYRHPCRYLHRERFTCALHGTPEQPQICVNYNPYHCWYRRTLTTAVSDDFLRIDRQRMEYLAGLLEFDEAGAITAIPEWEALVAGVAALPLEPAPPAGEPPDLDPAHTAWQQITLQLAEPAPEPSYSLSELRDPCGSCAAYCCSTLVFPHGRPTSAAGLDFLKFCLGFPGIELGVADEGWSLVVKTRCRHLAGARCGVYGQPGRPLICRYYDAMKCSYRPNFGTPRPPGLVRVKLEQFAALAATFRFNEAGAALAAPSVAEVRQAVEEQWRAEAGLPAPAPAPAPAEAVEAGD